MRGNVVAGSSADLVFVRGAGNSYTFENNVFSGTTPTMTFQGGVDTLMIAHNTMIGSSDRAIVLYGDPPLDAKVINNLVVAATKPLDLESGPTMQIAGNLELATTDAAMFTSDAMATIPYELASASPAVDAGVKVDGVTDLDFAGRVRDATPDAGAEEFGASLPPTGAGGADAATTSSSSTSTMAGPNAATGAGAGGGDVAKTPSDDGGCSISAGASDEGGVSRALSIGIALAFAAAVRTKRHPATRGRR